MADLQVLIHHLKKCPETYLQNSILLDGSVHTEALIRDMFRKVMGSFMYPDKSLPPINHLDRFNENQFITLHIGCWLFSERFFLSRTGWIQGVHSFLFQELPPLANHVKYRQWLEDEDRAEEFVRLALWSCEILPNGETMEEASDKFEALSTLKRQSVLKESNASLERIKEIRRKMAEEKAREAANPYGRE